MLDGGQIRVVATDGHRLSYAARPLGQQQEKREVILPRKAVLELGRLLADSDDAVTIEIFASLVRFSFGGIVLDHQDHRRQVSGLHAGGADQLPEAVRDRAQLTCSSRCSAPRSCRTRNSAACAG